MHRLNDPVMVQFGRFVADLAVLDLGESIRQGRPATTIVLEAYPTSLKLAFVTMTLAVILSTILGVWASFRPGGALDRIISILSLGSASAPNFWVALTLISKFPVALRLLPTSGTGGFPCWIMPITVLVLRPLASLHKWFASR